MPGCHWHCYRGELIRCYLPGSKHRFAASRSEGRGEISVLSHLLFPSPRVLNGQTAPWPCVNCRVRELLEFLSMVGFEGIKVANDQPSPWKRPALRAGLQ